MPFVAPPALGRLVRRAWIDWTGDDVNNRDVDLGEECDLVFVFCRTSRNNSVDHLAQAYAFGDVYGVNYVINSHPRHYANGAGDAWWQGFQVGTTNIRCGSVGNDIKGTNADGELYRAVGFRLRTRP